MQHIYCLFVIVCFVVLLFVALCVYVQLQIHRGSAHGPCARGPPSAHHSYAFLSFRFGWQCGGLPNQTPHQNLSMAACPSNESVRPGYLFSNAKCVFAQNWDLKTIINTQESIQIILKKIHYHFVVIKSDVDTKKNCRFVGGI